MIGDWKLGEMALIECSDGEFRRAMFSTHPVDRHAKFWAFPDGLRGMPDSVARPLVVIDAENREQVEQLAIAYAAAVSARLGDKYLTWENRSGEARSRIVVDLQAALRELANPTPPKPDEPTGLGAVVEVDGQHGVRKLLVRTHNTITPWAGDGMSRAWSEIDGPIDVLSEGVQR